MRPETVVPDTLEKPFPIVEETEIINGFGRGSSELGIPTANIVVSESLNQLDPGIYFGYCKVTPRHQDIVMKKRDDGKNVEFNHGTNLSPTEIEVFPMVMSIGFNPYYKNESKTAEIHIINKFASNFYGANVKYAIIGYVRPELNYTTKEALIEDINLDIKISLEALKKDNYVKAKSLV